MLFLFFFRVIYLLEIKRLTCRWRINREEEACQQGEEDRRQPARCGGSRQHHYLLFDLFQNFNNSFGRFKRLTLFVLNQQERRRLPPNRTTSPSQVFYPKKSYLIVYHHSDLFIQIIYSSEFVAIYSIQSTKSTTIAWRLSRQRWTPLDARARISPRFAMRPPRHGPTSWTMVWTSRHYISRFGPSKRCDFFPDVNYF